MLPRVLALLVVLIAAPACSEVQETAGRAADCVQLARDAAAAGLSGTPSVADAEAAAQRLDERVRTIDDAQLREDAAALRDRLRELTEAARGADPARVTAAADCVQLARDAAAAGLSGTPSVADAEAAAQRLDERVRTIDDAQLREDATALRDRLRELTEAARGADPARVTAAAEGARQAARDAAATCGIPVDQFLG